MPNYKLIGHDYQTPDIVAKVLGHSKYAEDFRADGMLFCKLLLSPEPHARVRHIDASAALAMEGVVAILTADDLPPAKPDNDPFGAAESNNEERGLTKEPVYEGEPILAVAAVDEATAAEAIERIKLDLELLPFCVDPLDSLRPRGPNARTQGNVFAVGGGMKTLKWTEQDLQEVAAGRIPWDGIAAEETRVGDVEAGFKQADLILDETLFQQSTAHQPLETRSAMAYWQNGKLFLFGSTQSVSQTVPLIAKWVGIDPSQLVFISEYCGGGFGSKALGAVSMAIPAMLSKKAGRPVMMRLSREEETYIGRMRPGFQARAKIGFRKDGRITAMDLFIVEDSGPYERQGDNELTAVVASALYQPLALRFRGISVATNTPPRSAQRGPGGMQGMSMLEPLMNRAARELGLDQVEIRKINAPSDGSLFGITDTKDSPRQPLTSAYVREALDRGKELFKWEERKARNGQRSGNKVRGVSAIIGTFFAGSTGYDGLVVIKPDGKLYIHQGIGNLGTHSVMDTGRVAAEVLGMPWDMCEIVWGNTANSVPWSSVQDGSQTTHAHSRANLAAGLDAKRKLQEIAAKELGGAPESYDVDNGRVYQRGNPGRGMTFAKAAESAIALGGKYDGHEVSPSVNSMTKASAQALAGQGLMGVAKDEFPHKGGILSFAAAFAEVEVDLETGQHRIIEYLPVGDVGTIMHPRSLGAQFHGGGIQGFGHARTQNVIYDPHYGKLVSRRLYQNKPPTILDMPLDMQWEALNIPDPQSPIGAKGVGETSALAGSAAVLCAIENALGNRCVVRTPVTAERILEAVRAEGKRPTFLSTYA
ncbi:MAG TPA: xanthine dehydrogenase family protein molybdopterin-binding subunit [Bryobacteraceae bacterium]|nr:xanthine dehydrogenase family protein molybdopterin-binding subunit [Dongiaceae bacterium]HVO97749.1 xanthine dehydrogenase family protein molybdopterin-binding subunit [Bryobacteraceae bacterium]